MSECELLDIEAIVAEVNKSMKQTVMRIGNDPDLALQLVPTSIGPLDEVLGGGIPRGRYCLVIGNFSTGKTFFCQRTIRAAQARGMSTAYIDTERAYNPDWFATSGVDVTRLPVASPTTGEDAFDVLHKLVELGVDLVVVDSLAAMVPATEVEEGMSHATVGLQARLISQGLRKLFAVNKNSVVLLTNQIRPDISGARWGSPETVPGGKAQEYWAWLTFKMRRRGWIMNHKEAKDQRRVGFNMVFEITKSKQCAPYQNIEVPFFFTGKLDVLQTVVDSAIERKVIEQKGASYAYKEQKFVGRQKLIDYLTETEGAEDALWQEVQDAAR
jgi:recombination protein RecA